MRMQKTDSIYFSCYSFLRLMLNSFTWILISVLLFNCEIHADNKIVGTDGAIWHEYDLKDADLTSNHEPPSDTYAKAETIFNVTDLNYSGTWDDSDPAIIEHSSIAATASILGWPSESSIVAQDTIRQSFQVAKAGRYLLKAILVGTLRIDAGGTTVTGYHYSDFQCSIASAFYQQDQLIGGKSINRLLYDESGTGDIVDSVENEIVTNIVDKLTIQGVGHAIGYYQDVHKSGLQSIVVIDEKLDTNAWLEPDIDYTYQLTFNSETVLPQTEMDKTFQSVRM